MFILNRLHKEGGFTKQWSVVVPVRSFEGLWLLCELKLTPEWTYAYINIPCPRGQGYIPCLCVLSWITKEGGVLVPHVTYYTPICIHESYFL